MPNIALSDDELALIYEGPLEPRPWQSFLDRFRARWDCDYAALTIQDAHLGAPTLLLSERVETPRSEMERLGQLHRRLARFDPLGDALAERGGILTLADVISPQALEDNIFYREVLVPRGIRRQIGMQLVEPGGFRANLGLMAGADGRAFGAAEKAHLAAIKPHMDRALALFSRIQRSEHSKSVFEDALGRLNIAMFLIDGAQCVVDLNGAARALCDSGEVSVVRGKLALRGLRDTSRLQQALHEADARAARSVSHAAIFRTEQADPPLDVLVRTVPQSFPSRSDVTAKMAVYLSAPGMDFAASQDFVSELLQLTPTEARLTLLLAEGLTLREAASRIGVTENTARSYSKQIFEKTGVRRQAELVRLILKSVVLLA